MPQNDLASVANRMAPGAYATSPPKIAFVAGAQAATQLRATSSAGSFRYISVKTSGAACGLLFGDLNVADPTTNAGFLLEATDGWVDMILPIGITHVRIYGAGIGTLYVWDRGT
jgi:hypothetical protein